MQMAFYFDQTRCIGCFTCCVACKDWNDIPAGPAHWRRIIPFEEGKFPRPYLAYLSTACYHCEDPLCAVVCPSEAITKRADGVVVVDREQCRDKARCGITDNNLDGEVIDIAACEINCPAHVNVPGYNALIAKGRFKEALVVIRDKLPLPGVLGRVCSYPCESECKRNDLDRSVAIKDLKRFVYDSVLDDHPTPIPQIKDQSIAIIGSGPAGLSVAYDLIRKGYKVTIFESLPAEGGMMAVGIPSYRLPREVLNRDIKYLKNLGIEIRVNTPIGKELTIDDLFKIGFEAVFIAVGAHDGKKLSIAGTEAKNVLVGTSFLQDVNVGNKTEIGQRVLVIGGGNIAIDCARTSLRLGAEKVEIACLEAKDQMPALASEVREAEMEGILIHPSCYFDQVVCRDDYAVGIECSVLNWMEFDKDGKLHTDVIEGTEHILEADTIIFAVGQKPYLGDLLKNTGIEVSVLGTIVVDPITMQTSRPGVFAGGDAVTGTAWIIDAIAAGQKAATYIDYYLKGEVIQADIFELPLKASDIKVEIPTDLVKEDRQTMPTLPLKERIENFNEIELGYDVEQAIAEAKRCLNCAGKLCLRVCPYNIPQFETEKNAKMQKCDFCAERLDENKKPICVEACIMRALDSGPIKELKNKYGEQIEATGFIYSSAKPSIVFKPKKIAAEKLGSSKGEGLNERK